MAADEHLRRSFDALASRLRDEISRQLDAISGELSSSLSEERSRAAAAAEEDRVRARAEERDLARLEALELARAEHEAADLSASLRLLEAIRAIDRAKSLSEILDTLAGCAGREAARVAVLLLRGNDLRGWRFIGFGPPLDESTSLECALADAGVVADAVRTGAAASGDSAAHASAPAFAALPPGRETLALPVGINGHIVAVLYADQGASPVPGESSAGRRMAWPAALEIMTRHAARSLEAITAVRAAQIVTQRPDAAAEPPAGAASGAAEEEQSARRYARLLISEIKLYHEPEVIAGRRERNLAERLGGEISRARSLYEQRVPVEIRQRGDYFHDELVRTLADGDGELVAKS